MMGCGRWIAGKGVPFSHHWQDYKENHSPYIIIHYYYELKLNISLSDSKFCINPAFSTILQCHVNTGLSVAGLTAALP